MRPFVIFTPFNRSFSFWPFCFIASCQKDDPSFLVHETVHWGRQTLWSPIWVLLYFLFPAFRWREEKLAYAAQIGWYKGNGWRSNNTPDWFVNCMATEYGVLFCPMCSEAEARAFVDGEMNKQEGGK